MLTVVWLVASPGGLAAAGAAVPGHVSAPAQSWAAGVWPALEAMRMAPAWDLPGVACGVVVVLILFAGPLVDGVWAGAEAFSNGLAPGMAAFDDEEDGAGERELGEVAPVVSRRAVGGACGLFRCVLSELSDYDDAAQCPPPHDRERQLLILRDLVAAPLLEEALFRGCMGALVLAAGAGPEAACWLVPLVFAGAHLHLGAQSLARGEPLGRVLGVSLVRTAYTFAFGGIAMRLWVGTRTLAAPVAAHLLCNWLGLPDVQRVVGHLRAAAACDGTPRSRAAVPRAAVVVTTYAAGVVGFFAAMPVLTAWAAAASGPDLVAASR